MKSIVNYKYDKEFGGYHIIVDNHIIQDIVLNWLPLGNEFTISDILQQWYKHWHKSLGKVKQYWPPKRQYIERAMDELLSNTFTKEYVSTKKSDGSITEAKYKRLS